MQHPPDDVDDFVGGLILVDVTVRPGSKRALSAGEVSVIAISDSCSRSGALYGCTAGVDFSEVFSLVWGFFSVIDGPPSPGRSLFHDSNRRMKNNKSEHY